MPVYLRACDIIYTKPGGLTSTEAAVTEISIVHTKPIPGCETKNRSFFVKKGMSVTAYTEYGLVRRGMQALHNPGKRNAMQRAQHRGMEKHSAEKDISVCKSKDIAGERHSRYASFYLLNFFKLIRILL